MSNSEKPKGSLRKTSWLSEMLLFFVLTVVGISVVFCLAAISNKIVEPTPVKSEEYVNSESPVSSKPIQEEKVILWFFSGVFGYAAIYTIGKYVSEK